MALLSRIILPTISLAALLIGCGPTPNIIPDAKIGQEYPAPDEQEISNRTLEMILETSRKNYPDGARVLRDAHPKAHGCVKANFEVANNVPPELAHGIFIKANAYPAWIRYSNGAPEFPNSDKAGGIRGMAVKLMDVPGEKLLADEKNARTQDFLLISFPILPVGEPSEYLEIFEARFTGSPMKYFFGWNPFKWKLRAFNIVRKIRAAKAADPFEVRYFSTTPYRLGQTAVKYSTKPCELTNAKMPENPGDNYLREAMVSRLKSGGACFEFMVQPQIDAVKMPLEDSSIEWDEQASPFVTVAKIQIPPQEFDTADLNLACDNLSFTPWHSLPEHQPLGGINRVRKTAYEGVSKFRHEQNKEKRQEP
ncbi:MAG: catalase family protein [Spirochaetia bacterium]|nr:catalase family protein [Spirochaetia bacterium]